MCILLFVHFLGGHISSFKLTPNISDPTGRDLSEGTSLEDLYFWLTKGISRPALTELIKHSQTEGDIKTDTKRERHKERERETHREKEMCYHMKRQTNVTPVTSQLVTWHEINHTNSDTETKTHTQSHIPSFCPLKVSVGHMTACHMTACDRLDARKNRSDRPMRSKERDQ